MTFAILSQARRQLLGAHGVAARAQRLVARRRRALAADHGPARRACGPGVAL